jgi:hypothetical protein
MQKKWPITIETQIMPLLFLYPRGKRGLVNNVLYNMWRVKMEKKVPIVINVEKISS